MVKFQPYQWLLSIIMAFIKHDMLDGVFLKFSGFMPHWSGKKKKNAREGSLERRGPSLIERNLATKSSYHKWSNSTVIISLHKLAVTTCFCHPECLIPSVLPQRTLIPEYSVPLLGWDVFEIDLWQFRLETSSRLARLASLKSSTLIAWGDQPF